MMRRIAPQSVQHALWHQRYPGDWVHLFFNTFRTATTDTAICLYREHLLLLEQLRSSLDAIG